MKKILIAAAILFSISAAAQPVPKVTDTILIKMDTITYKKVMILIRENIDSRTATGQMVIGSIVGPLQNFTFLQPADKPKESIKPK